MRGLEKTTGALKFGSPVTAPHLPLNYMPAVLPALRGQGQQSGCILLPVNADGPAFVTAAGSVLQDPATLSEYLMRAGSQPAPSASSGTKRSAEASSAEGQAILVIDYGIAFWNHRFVRSDGTPRFRSVSHLSFDEASADGVRIDTLSASEIAEACRFAGQSGGEVSVIRSLGQQFAKGFFNQSPDPDGFWHGTAVSDLSGGADPDGSPLFGIELPTAAVADSSGDTLQAILPSALRTALTATAAVADLPLTIVLAFGYPGGPHDGTHPAAQIISRFLARANADRKVRLIVPAGNHLQDCCAAVLPAAHRDIPAPSVIWRVPPGDFSGNTILICLADGEDPEIALAAPGGASDRIKLSPGQFAPLHLDGSVVGGLHCLPGAGGSRRLRLSLAGTGWNATGPRPAASGDWHLSIRADSDANLWILRDDRSRIADRDRPARPSLFADPAYRELDTNGAYILTDAATGTLRRSGTASVLTTASGAVSVQADERIGHGRLQPAFYSGLRTDDRPFDRHVLVDDGWQGKGCDVVANGRPQRFRMSGTSAAAAIAARDPWSAQEAAVSS
jgi:hypothetical protein